MKTVKKIAVVTIVTYILVEIVCFIFIKTKFTTAHFPNFHFTYNYTRYDFPFGEINPVWGTWHYPGTYMEAKPCFESVYNINAYGARDKERKLKADTNRVIFLGDSFIEGYGLSENARLTNILESRLQKEVLNFGCGYFTPTQAYLLYDSLAKHFSHNTVVIGILPFNDLIEDDTSFHEKDGFEHFQPYYQGTYPNYNLIYRREDLSTSTFNKEGYYQIQNTAKARRNRFLKEFTFWYNIYHFIQERKPVQKTNGLPYSGYYDCTKPQLQKLSFILEKLKTAASGKRLLVVALPVQNDLLRFRTNEYAPFSMYMSKESERLHFQFVDLLPVFKTKADPDELYLSCDGHWNAKANQIAAEIILPLLADK